MKVVVGQRIKCLRCGKRWQTRKTEIRMCPTCKSPYFNVPREKREAIA